MGFAERLKNEGDKESALLAMENALAVLWWYPNYGFAGDRTYFVARDIWEAMRQLDIGDKFDRTWIECHCALTQRWIDFKYIPFRIYI